MLPKRLRLASREPMSVDEAAVRKIASLARIAVTDTEVAAMTGELNNILGWVEQLGEVDTDGSSRSLP
jgi:aspartyl-tRNA(Asn)/glutamyl-tRNA(Gln) amidotransferase subunit C